MVVDALTEAWSVMRWCGCRLCNASSRAWPAPCWAAARFTSGGRPWWLGVYFLNIDLASRLAYEITTLRRDGKKQNSPRCVALAEEKYTRLTWITTQRQALRRGRLEAMRFGHRLGCFRPVFPGDDRTVQ